MRDSSLTPVSPSGDKRRLQVLDQKADKRRSIALGELQRVAKHRR